MVATTVGQRPQGKRCRQYHLTLHERIRIKTKSPVQQRTLV